MRTTLTLICCALLGCSASRGDDSLADSIERGSLDVDLRYRYEWVDQQGVDRHANASTARLRLGYTTAGFHGLFFRAQFQGDFSIDDNYNSTGNGRTQFPIVADPEDSNFSELLVGYGKAKTIELRLGRQAIVFDNERFFGPVGWRQLIQTHDALSVRSSHFEGFELTYVYSGNAIRVFGEHNPNETLAETDQDSHLFHAAWESGVGRLVGYVHLLRFPDNPLASHANVGVRFSGKQELERFHVLYEAEYADQSSYRGGAAAIDAQYLHAVAGAGCRVGTVRLGYELLGGDGVYAFQTPFATLHPFNGWADRFPLIPADGLQDLYLALDGKLGGIGFGAVYHDFSPDNGNGGYGEELDLLLTRSWTRRCSLGVKYADYSADADASGLLASDASKFWLWLQYKD